MTADPLGKTGPHPDLLDLMATHFSESFVQAGRNITIARGDLELLQQRTFFDQPHPNPRIGSRAIVSSCLAVLHPPSQAASNPALGTHLLLFQALQPEGTQSWSIVGSTIKGLGDPPLQPFVGAILVSRLGLACGAFVSNLLVARQQVELADGTVAEDTVAARSLYHFVPFHSPAAWAREAVVRLFDTSGVEIVSQQVYVRPNPPPGISPRRPRG